MSSSVLDAFHAELEAALQDGASQRRMLSDLAALPLSDETHEGADRESAAVSHRQALMQAALDALNALTSDGYPDTPKTAVAESVLQQLADQKAAVQHALDVLTRGNPEPQPQAKTIHVALGQPAQKG